MRQEIPANAAIIAAGIMRLGGRAKLSDIYREVARINTDWREQYSNEKSFEGTVRGTIEAHCPQSDNFRYPELPLFEWVEAGVYKVVAPGDWVDALGRRKPLGGNRRR
jgi:hypothetical protein